MSAFKLAGIVAIAMLVGAVPLSAATFVYVSNAEDGEIGVYRLLDSGELQPGARAKAGRHYTVHRRARHH